MMRGLFRAICVLAFTAAPNALLAQTATGSFDVRITIAQACAVASGSSLNFGNNGVLSANVDQSATITVTCSDATPYTLGLGAGSATNATVSTRAMTGPGGATISYALYRDAARTLNWGNTGGTDTIAYTGTGTGQAHTIYGRVPPQATPAAGTYVDTVAITVTY